MPDKLAHYSLGSTDEEHRRLIALASHEEEHVVGACRRAGVGRGATVIDVGCGPLGALRALARVVGKGGRVIGIDASERAVERARALVPAAQVTTVHADVHEFSLAPEARADAVYSRLFLLHQRDPEQTLRRIARLLTPGGVVIAHEPSDDPSHAPASEPHVPAMRRVWELVIAAARARGARTDFGRAGRRSLERAGFTVESHRAYVVHYPPETGYDIPRIALHSLRPALAEHGLADDEEIGRLDRELSEAKTRPDVQWVSSPLMLEWIGRM